MVKRISIVFLTLTFAGMILFACTGEHSTCSEPPPEILYTELNWVGTEVLYRADSSKHDHSLLFIFASWCGWCKRLKEETLTDSLVIQKLGESFNIAQIDGTSQRHVVYFDTTVTSRHLALDIYGVRGYPTFVFLDRDGATTQIATGYREPENFINLLETVLAENPVSTAASVEQSWSLGGSQIPAGLAVTRQAN